MRIFLAEKAMTVQLVTVELGEGERHSEAYRAINPRRVVPTLVLEDGTATGEVLAIMRYLEETYPRKPLEYSRVHGKTCCGSSGCLASAANRLCT